MKRCWNECKGSLRRDSRAFQDLTSPPEKLSEARDFIEFLSQKSKKKRGFSKLCGILSDEDAETMMKAIEEDCEKINYEEW